MKLANLEVGGRARVGVVQGEQLRLLPDGSDLVELLALDPAEREQLAASASEAVELQGARLLPSVEPSSVRDFVTFEQHVEGVVLNESPDKKVMPDWYDAPHFYFSSPTAIYGDGDDIEVPPGSKMFDFELEVAAVIGRAGRDLHPEEAWEHIGGFTIYNDFSARDHGFREIRLGLGWGKAKDSANVLGPWVVTTDELEGRRVDDRLDLSCSVIFNGEKLGTDSLASMAWSFGDMLAYASRGAELKPGDVLGSGTCGFGCLAELWGRNGAKEPAPLKPGDEVELVVDGIGTLTNYIVAGVDPVPIPAARRRAAAVGQGGTSNQEEV